MPSNLTFDQAASVPVSPATTALDLYNKKAQPYGGLGLSLPWEKDGRGKYAGQPIMIMGGAAAVGQYGMALIQLKSCHLTSAYNYSIC